MLPTLNFGRHVLNQIEIGITKEWIETNGKGAYSMGTIIGANTRRHHALFSANSQDGLNRTILVNRIEEAVLLNGQKIDCSCQEYPNTISPQGHLQLETFRSCPFPTWTLAIQNIKISKSFFLMHGQDVAVLHYKHLVGPSVKMLLRPFFSCRDQNDLIREDDRFNDAIEIRSNFIKCKVKGMPEFFTQVAQKRANGTESYSLFADGYWYKNLLYAHDEEKGINHNEDLYSPGQIVAEINENDEISLVFSCAPIDSPNVSEWVAQETAYRERALPEGTLIPNFKTKCAISAKKLLVLDKTDPDIISGFPWVQLSFRESLMSLPGICLATGNTEAARSILLRMSKAFQNIIVPFSLTSSDPEMLEYPNMDAPLWWVWALQKYFAATQDAGILMEVKHQLEHILKSYESGVTHSDPGYSLEIRMDTDALLWGSSTKWPLTWMDRKIMDSLITPRKGKPVEVQALWYNALMFYSEIAPRIDSDPRPYASLAEKVKMNFNLLFWNAQTKYLYDVIDGNFREGSVRPNALYSISLPYAILDQDKFKTIFETAGKSLYTSFGLRTLSPTEPHFHSLYKGDQKNLALAKHNGTVFSFFIGPFLTAYFKTYGSSADTREKAVHMLMPFVDHLADAGLGMISEMFDGKTPHAPRGISADARGLAEILRVMNEEQLEL